MPVRYPRVLIVTAPDPSRTVVYDFNDDTQTLATGSKTDLTAADWSFGQLDLLGDPDAVGVEWALQRISFKQTITGTKAAAMARQVAMSRALLTTRFWVEFQLDATTAPVWWHGYRTPPGEVLIEQVYVPGNLPDRWEIAGGIDVDPFSYSAWVTQATQTVGNDPASEGSAPTRGYTLPTIKGDALTNLRVQVTPSTVTNAKQKWLVACIASTGTDPVTYRTTVGNSDNMTPFNGTSGGASNAGAAGGSYRTLAFSSAARAVRLQGILGVGAGVAPGRYLVMQRVAATRSSGVTSATLTFELRGGVGDSLLGSLVSETWTEASTDVDNYKMVTLGVIGIADGLPLNVGSVPTSKQFSLYITSSDSGAAAKLDDFVLIRIAGPDVSSATTLVTTPPSGPFSTRGLLVDGDSEVSWVFGDEVATNAGGFPAADPAAAVNTLIVMPLSCGSAPGDTQNSRSTGLGSTAQLVVSYMPRNTYLGDGT